VNEFFARLGVALINLTGHLRQPTRTFIANMLADLFWFFARPHRHVTLTNLRLCFPQMAERVRIRIGRNSFRNMLRAALDHSILWHANRAEIERYVHIEGEHHLTDDANRPLILIAPHFFGLDAGGVRASILMQLASIYSRQKNSVWDDWLLKARQRFNEPILIQRQDLNMRQVVRVLKDGVPFYYLPDTDLGPINSIFVPFFGVDAATIPMVSRLARLTGAKVIMAVTEMTRDGYVIHIDPPWTDFPGASVEDDTARMNRELERWVLRLPDQYLWSHKRFKTRPPGEGRVY
jgi:Kdo2-lipid IVA lauroyltransferase/acyltransferase